MSANAEGRHVAVLVIHGIGEQNPYETLDGFARGLADHVTPPDMCARRIRHSDWTEVCIEFDRLDLRDPTLPRKISLFEYYWAPYTEGKVSYLDVFWWLVATASRPLRQLASNLQELFASQASSTAAPRATVARIVGRELRRTLGIYIPFLALLAYLGWLLSYVPDLPALVKAVQALIAPEANRVPLALLAFGIVVTLVMLNWLRSVVVHWERGRGPQTLEGAAERTMLRWATFIAAVGVALSACAWSWMPTSAREQLVAVFNLRTTVAVAMAVFAWVLKRIFVDFLGDVSIYTTSDEKAKSYQARSAILKGSTDAVTRLLACKEYDEVIIAGHSLGSVIAYDTVNRLLDQTVADPDGSDGAARALTYDDLQRLTGLVTFGSPLGKIYYFFRQHVGRNQAFRAQILSMLYGFQRKDSRREYGRFNLELRRASGACGRPQLPRLRWINAYSSFDPISGSLEFYAIPENDQLALRYYRYGLAHLQYWSDPRFYVFITNRLLRRAEAGQATGDTSLAASA